MTQKIKFNDKEYELEKLSDEARSTLTALEFINTRLNELTNMQALLTKAKSGYIESLKKEVLSNKAGLVI